jgi:hypothetical protein
MNCLQWPSMIYNYGQKCQIYKKYHPAEYLPVQNICANHPASVRDDRRKFSPDWPTRTFSTSEHVKRQCLLLYYTWNIYFVFSIRFAAASRGDLVYLIQVLEAGGIYLQAWSSPGFFSSDRRQLSRRSSHLSKGASQKIFLQASVEAI